MNRLLRHRGYLPALLVLLLVVLLHFALIPFFGARVPGLIVAYLVAFLWASWCGYGPGILNCVLMLVVLPQTILPASRLGQFNIRTFIIFLLLSLLVSTVSASRAKTEAMLRSANAQLDERVQQRTAELEKTNTELGHRLAELENLYRKLSVGVAFLDGGLRFRRLNEQMACFNGAPLAAHAGQPFREMVPPAIADSLEPVLRRILETGEAVVDHPLQSSFNHDSQDLRHWLFTCSPVHADSGTVIGVQVLAQDVTERKRFDESLRHTAKLESLGILAGGIAHDFNNLLTGILGNAGLAQDMLPPRHATANLLANVIIASERAADLTRQLLAYAGKGRFVIEPVNLSVLIRDLQPLIATSAENRVDIRLDLLPESVVAGDPGQMQQLIMNLVINGAESIPEGEPGIVTVRTSLVDLEASALPWSGRLVGGGQLPAGSYLLLEVRDTGCGMDAATMDRIFDPFFTTKFVGRGLGLAAALGIVRGHRGGLIVDSTPDVGTAFQVLLPAASSAVRSPRQPAKLRQDHAGQAVLVVDDEDMVRHTAKACLETYGYHVVEADSGARAIELLHRTPNISLVILDLTMPEMDGEKTCRELRRIRPALKVILSSGHDETNVMRRFEGQTLSGFVQKPFTVASLISKVNEALPRAAVAHD